LACGRDPAKLTGSGPRVSGVEALFRRGLQSIYDCRIFVVFLRNVVTMSPRTPLPNVGNRFNLASSMQKVLPLTPWRAGPSLLSEPMSFIRKPIFERLQNLRRLCITSNHPRTGTHPILAVR
jgi:hypothetical protein